MNVHSLTDYFWRILKKQAVYLSHDGNCKAVVESHAEHPPRTLGMQAALPGLAHSIAEELAVVGSP